MAKCNKLSELERGMCCELLQNVVQKSDGDITLCLISDCEHCGENVKSKSNICSKLQSRQCYSTWNLTRPSKNITFQNSSIWMNWAFGWSCYCKACVTFPFQDFVTYKVLNNRAPPLFNKYLDLPVFFFAGSVIFTLFVKTPITCRVSSVSPPSRDSGLHVHTHPLLIRCNARAAFVTRVLC